MLAGRACSACGRCWGSWRPSRRMPAASGGTGIRGCPGPQGSARGWSRGGARGAHRRDVFAQISAKQGQLRAEVFSMENLAAAELLRAADPVPRVRKWRRVGLLAQLGRWPRHPTPLTPETSRRSCRMGVPERVSSPDARLEGGAGDRNRAIWVRFWLGSSGPQKFTMTRCQTGS